MTVLTTTSKISYNGNGVTTVFSFPYPFIAATDIVVKSVSATGVITTLTTGYSVGGTAPFPSGANVTLTTAPAVNTRLVLSRVRPRTQDLDLVENDPLPSDQVELTFDSVVMLIQELDDTLSRTPKLDITSTQANLTLADLVANMGLQVNSNATGIVMSTYTPSDIANAAANATAAAASAATAALYGGINNIVHATFLGAP